MPITLQDIATKLGVAKSTVSFTLRNHPKAQQFSQNTRQRIFQAAQELGYRPNFYASQLSGGRPKLLMLCLSYLRDTWASMVAEGFEAQASQRGYRVLIATFHDREDPLALHRDVLGSQGAPAAAILGASTHKLTDEALRGLLDEGVRVVLVGRELDDPRVAHVLTDNYLGGQLAARHLYEDLGLEDAWVVGVRGRLPLAQRLKGFCDTARALGKPQPRQIVVPDGRAWIEHSQAAFAQAIQTHGRPRGVFAAGDVLAVGASHAMAEIGWITGRDVAVVGFDGGIYSVCHYPPLTTVAQPMMDMGQKAADLLIQMLEEPELPAKRVVIPPVLQVKGSTDRFLKPDALPEGTTTVSRMS